MPHVSDYSLNYSRQLSEGKMRIFDFLSQCRRLRPDAASIHVRNLPTVATGYLKTVRRDLDNGLSMSMVTVSTNFGNPRQGERAELETAIAGIRVGMLLGAPILRVFAGSPRSEADREEAFRRAMDGVRKVVEEAADGGCRSGCKTTITARCAARGSSASTS